MTAHKFQTYQSKSRINQFIHFSAAFWMNKHFVLFVFVIVLHQRVICFRLDCELRHFCWIKSAVGQPLRLLYLVEWISLNLLDSCACCDQPKHTSLSLRRNKSLDVASWPWFHLSLSFAFVYQGEKCAKIHASQIAGWKSVVANAANDCPHCLWSICADCTQQLEIAWGRPC